MKTEKNASADKNKKIKKKKEGKKRKNCTVYKNNNPRTDLVQKKQEAFKV